MPRLNPPQIIVISFLSAILVGTIFLSLPIASRGQLGPVDALFTATSAICVTGLVVKDTGSFFTPFGQLVILILVQMGGLGIMTFSTTFAILLGRKLSIRENVVIQRALDHHKIQGLRDLLKHILLVTFAIEAVGVGLLFLRWNHILNQRPLLTLYHAIFHSVSAFCNAGFSLYRDSFIRYRSDTFTNLIMTTLIIAGGIGFVVLLDIPKLKLWRKDRALILSRVSLQSKLVLSLSALLIAIGMVTILVFEKDDIFAGMGLKERLLSAYFYSVTPRTAGFNTLPTEKLRRSTTFFTLGLMFIGASPGSTGGGIKTVTFGILAAAFVAMLKNRDRISIFRKTIPKEVFRKALMIFILGLSWIFLFTLLLCSAEKVQADQPNFLLRNLFEVTSAFGTVGLTTGITPNLTSLGKLLVTLTILVGRIGPLTLIMAVAVGGERVSFVYPEERVMVG